MKIKPFREWKDSTKICLFRMWAAGAVCFFGAWGRSGAEIVGNAYSLNLAAGLIVLLILSDLIIVDPVIRLAFKTKREFTDGLRVLRTGLLHIIKITVIMLVIIGTYHGLNRLIIAVFNLDRDMVPVPLEPILFGLLYGLYFSIYTLVEKQLAAKKS